MTEEANPGAPGSVLDSVVPYHRLPSGFLRMLDEPPDPPAIPQPSATLVLLRRSPERVGKSQQMEVLLLKRSPRSGFIPGAWVFPGGRVDEEDGDPGLLMHLDGLSPGRARERLRLGNARPDPTEDGNPDAQKPPPPWAYWVAAIRETFEETGVLLRKSPDGAGPLVPKVKELALEEGREDLISEARSRLLSGLGGFLPILQELGIVLDAGSLEYSGHWLTPECEPRRYETLFFITEMHPEARVTPHEKEMVDALWITPEQALARNLKGEFPLVFPTLVTLEELTPFPTPEEALSVLRGRPVPRRLPEPERAEGGVLFKLKE